METKDKAILIHALIYTTCFDIINKTKKVDKVLKQIRKGISKLDPIYYKNMSQKCHKSWEIARQSLIEVDGKLDVKMDELMMGLYNGIPREYRNMYYSDITFTAMANSFDSCLTNKADKFEYTQHGRDLADAFLKEIGVVKNPLLARMALTIKNNLILEGKL